MNKSLLFVLTIVSFLSAPLYAEDGSVPTSPEVAQDEDGGAVEPTVAAPVAAPVAGTLAPPAVDPAPEGALSKLSSVLFEVLVPAFLTLVGLFTTFVLNWLRKRLKLNVSNEQIASWSVVAEKAAHRGAEWARNKSKSYTEGKTVPGPEVLEVALDWAVGVGRQLKLPDMGREKLVGLIESQLSVRRADKGDTLPA